MTSNVWSSVEKIRNDLIETLEHDDMELPEFSIDIHGWSDIIWSGESFRRAHLSVVDERKSRGMMMLHFCVFPHIHNSAPIFGLDIIAGERKITGAFLDFSPVVEDHPMSELFHSLVEIYEWKRERKLPEWAEVIFSEHIVAAGNITDEEELIRLIRLSITCLSAYIDVVGKYNHTANSDDVIASHNRYVIQQKQNPRLYSSMKSFGLSDDQIASFVNKCLFPEI